MLFFEFTSIADDEGLRVSILSIYVVSILIISEPGQLGANSSDDDAILVLLLVEVHKRH